MWIWRREPRSWCRPRVEAAHLSRRRSKSPRVRARPAVQLASSVWGRSALQLHLQHNSEATGELNRSAHGLCSALGDQSMITGGHGDLSPAVTSQTLLVSHPGSSALARLLVLRLAEAHSYRATVWRSYRMVQTAARQQAAMCRSSGTVGGSKQVRVPYCRQRRVQIARERGGTNGIGESSHAGAGQESRSWSDAGGGQQAPSVQHASAVLTAAGCWPCSKRA